MNTVITYAEAYRSRRQHTLCAECADIADTGAIEGIGPLGPVQHGARQGWCDVCDRTHTLNDEAQAYIDAGMVA